MKRFFFLLLFLILPLATADCLIYEESPYYCQDLDNGKAECELYSTCSIEQHIVTDSCENTPSCQTILCASNCEQMPANQCEAGPVPDPSWCEPGCCRLHYEGGNYCSLESTRAACDLTANNFGVEEYNYDTQINPLTCTQFCETAGALTTDVMKELPKKSTSLRSSSFDLDETQTSSQAQKQEEKSAFNAWLVLILALAMLIAYLIYTNFTKLTSLLSKPRQKLQQKRISPQDNDLNLDIPLVAPPPTKNYQRKVKEHKRQDLLREFGGDGLKHSPNVHKLANLTKYHQKRKNIPFEQLKNTSQDQAKRKKEESALDKLKKLIKNR